MKNDIVHLFLCPRIGLQGILHLAKKTFDEKTLGFFPVTLSVRVTEFAFENGLISPFFSEG